MCSVWAVVLPLLCVYWWITNQLLYWQLLYVKYVDVALVKSVNPIGLHISFSKIYLLWDDKDNLKFPIIRPIIY